MTGRQPGFKTRPILESAVMDNLASVVGGLHRIRCVGLIWHYDMESVNMTQSNY